jgi:hypothetical protein
MLLRHVLRPAWSRHAQAGRAAGDGRPVDLPARPTVLLALLYSVFRLLLDAMLDRHEWDAKAFVNFYAICSHLLVNIRRMAAAFPAPDRLGFERLTIVAGSPLTDIRYRELSLRLTQPAPTAPSLPGPAPRRTRCGPGDAAASAGRTVTTLSPAGASVCPSSRYRISTAENVPPVWETPVSAPLPSPQPGTPGSRPAPEGRQGGGPVGHEYCSCSSQSVPRPSGTRSSRFQSGSIVPTWR